MIMIFGPAGSGKTTQAELLAKKMGRVPLSVGGICREDFIEYTKNGDMVPIFELAAAVMRRVNAVGSEKVVLDGQPWEGEFVEVMNKSGMMAAIELAVVIDVPREECLKRLAARGRADDRQEVWNKKLNMFEQKIYTFLTGLESEDVLVKHVDGMGDIETISGRIEGLVARTIRQS